MRNISGPIGIARISGSVAESVQRSGDASLFFDFLAVISLKLGIFNLLPIPRLDVGVIALLLVEGIMRRELSINIKEKIVQVGFAFIIMLMGFVVFNDLSKIIDLHRFLKIL